VPFYRDLFARHGVRWEDVRGVADLGRLPMVSRTAFRAVPLRDTVAAGVDPARLVRYRTSGSSGEPLVIHRTWWEERFYALLRHRAARELGVRARDLRVTVVQLRHRSDGWRRLPERLMRAAGFYRRVTLDCLRAPAELLAEIRRLRPDVLTGYAGVIARLAQVADETGGAAPRPRLVVTGAEVLTPVMRRQIAAAFGARVLETYASYEAPALARQCLASEALHVAGDSAIVEVIAEGGRPARPGETGEVVVTALHSFAMPFIRYRLGDLVTRGESRCPCGEPTATIATVQGRMLDYFPLANGRTVHPYVMLAPLVDATYHWIQRYQLVQERPDRLLLLVVPWAPPAPEAVERAGAAIRDSAGPGTTVEVRLVSEIATEPSGKFRLARSLVASAYDAVDGDARGRRGRVG
jgi:phenylacetate-CoA ligase